MISVVNTLKVYEVDNREVKIVDERPTINVQSHWLYDDRIVITVGKECVTVLARDLESAIRNATNSGK